MALGWSAATWAGGQLITSIGFQNMFLTGAVLGLFGAGLILAQKWSVRPAQQQKPEEAETAQPDNVGLL
jgi:predicted MFS family arabinose efflux permease